MLRSNDLVRLCLIATIIVAAVVLAGCGGGSGGTGSTITGRVLDDGSLAAIPGAHVAAAGGQSIFTDANGFFVLAGVTSNATTLTAAAVDFQNRIVNVPAGSGGRDLGNVYLAPAPILGAGNVTGIVRKGGVPSPAAVIRSATREAIAKTDGTYTLYNVWAGFQTVLAVSANGLSGGSVNVTVQAQATITANISLTDQPPPPPI